MSQRSKKKAKAPAEAADQTLPEEEDVGASSGGTGAAGSNSSSFQCTLCMGKVSQSNIRGHFRTHHKITKVGAIEKLVTLGAAVSASPGPTSRHEDVDEEELEEQEEESASAGGGGQGRSTSQEDDYEPGALVQGHVVGYPWWPAIVNKVEKTKKTKTIHVMFFDKSMQAGRLDSSECKAWDAAGYAAYLKNVRKKYPAARVARLRQANDVCLKLAEAAAATEKKTDEGGKNLVSPAEWRHQFFCQDKKNLFDFLAQHTPPPAAAATTTLTVQELARQKYNHSANGSGDAAPPEKKPRTAAKPTKAAATDEEDAAAEANGGGTEEDHDGGGRGVDKNSSEVPDEGDDDGDDESAENDVNDVLSEMMGGGGGDLVLANAAK